MAQHRSRNWKTGPGFPAPRNILEKHYRENGDKHVAFLDESSREPSRGSGLPFYILTAVLIPGKDAIQRHAIVRQQIEQVRGPNCSFYVHATDLRREDPSQLAEFLRIFGEEAKNKKTLTVVSVQTEIKGREPRHQHDAREEALTGLAMTLCTPTAPNVGLFVAESGHIDRSEDGEPAVPLTNKIDLKVIRSLRNEKKITKDIRLIHASPSVELGLISADIASHSVYRDLAVDDFAQVQYFGERLVLINVSTGKFVNWVELGTDRQPSPDMHYTQQNSPRGIGGRVGVALHQVDTVGREGQQLPLTIQRVADLYRADFPTMPHLDK